MGDSQSVPGEKLGYCTRLAHCPVCGQENGCRLETGEGYKGPCWCEGPVLAATALARLLSDLPEPRCLCRGCLERIARDPEIPWEVLASERRTPASELLPGDSYLEGDTIVFTAQYHLRRGHCCGNGCRHCPY